MRSKLFVPGIRPDLFGKAYDSDADAISFDLEDAVPLSRKDEARAAVAGFLATQAARVAARCSIVRTNAVGSALFEADLAALSGTGIALLNLPCVESPDQVVAAVAAIERVEAATGATPRPRLLLNIETPRGLRQAARIAAAHPRVAGLQLGLGDLFEPYGIARDPAQVRMAMFQLAMAAAEAGVFACDGAHPDFQDEAVFAAEARMARDLGFAGKSCIHPRQVGWANDIFSPTAAELAWAQRVVAAAAEAETAARAVFVVDGRMIDPPYLRRAQRLLAQADAMRRAPGATA